MDLEGNLNEFHHTQKSSVASSNLLSLFEMQRQGHLCDVWLETDSGDQLAAHRAVLASASPYFKAMFVNNLIESTQRIVHIADMDFDLLEAVVLNAYNAAFVLPQDRVLYLMIAADLFQMTQLHRECSSFLEEKLQPGNCLSMRAYAGLYNCTSLFDLCTEYASNHFEQVVTCEEYLSLSCEALKELISRDAVRVTCEEQVYSAVLNWVYHKLDSRKESFPEVMSHVRLPFVSSQFLSSSVEQEELIRNEKQCKLLIEEAYFYKKSPEKRSSLRFSPRAKPRKPSGLQDVILTAGGMCKNHPLASVEQYSVDTNEWTVLCEMATARFGLAACFHDGCMYAIGGYNDAGYLDSVECYHVKKNEWRNATSMCNPRRYHAVHVLYGLIYATGGQDSQGILSLTECYNPDTDTWKPVREMNTQRMYHGMAEMDGYLFVLGGHSGHIRLDSMEFYDPSKDTWMFACSMSIPRSVAGVESIGGSIYAVGGYNGKVYLNSVESYDIEMNKWFPCPPMSISRSAMGLVTYDGCLYACGGFNGTFQTSVERYLPSAQCWEACTDMLVEKVHFGIACT